jgi:hypothetical protein
MVNILTYEKSVNWSSKNILKPDEVYKGSAKKIMNITLANNKVKIDFKYKYKYIYIINKQNGTILSRNFSS